MLGTLSWLSSAPNPLYHLPFLLLELPEVFAPWVTLVFHLKERAFVPVLGVTDDLSWPWFRVLRFFSPPWFRRHLKFCVFGLFVVHLEVHRLLADLLWLTESLLELVLNLH